jgi:lipopolysaccharide biosynthesis glycosyltransferase
MTRYSCLKLVQYEKIFYVDVDMIVQKNMDHIFKLPTPATRLVFQTHTNEKNRPITSVLVMNDGDAIPMDIANRVINNKLGGIDGGCMLLTPDIKQYEKMLVYVKTFDPRKFNATLGDDELALFSFYISQNIKWYYLGIKWSCIQWKYSGACNSENSYIINYIGLDKSWEKDLSHYPDLKVWYENWDRFEKKYPGLITLNFNKGDNSDKKNNSGNNNKYNNKKKGGGEINICNICLNLVLVIILLILLYFIDNITRPHEYKNDILDYIKI